MIFYRSAASEGSEGPSLKTIRTLSLISLIAYPVGAVTMLLGGAGRGGFYAQEIVGLALIALALIAAAPVLGSRLQRIVGDKAGTLDEMELQLRHRATSWSYFAFTALVCLAIFYGGVASDTGMWIPTEFEHWNGLFWGVFLYSSLLPTTFLAWTLSDDTGGE